MITNCIGETRDSPGLHLITLGDDNAVTMIAAERNNRSATRIHNAGNAANRLKNAIGEYAYVVIGGVSHQRHSNAGRDDSFRVESGIDRQQIPEACHQESRPDQQHKSEANLSNDQHAANSARFVTAGSCSAFFTQHRVDVDTDHLCNRNQADQNAGDQ